MGRIINKKNTYLLMLFVICLLGIVLVPTYAKFASNYTTPDDVVGISLAFKLTITNIEEYEEIVIPAGKMVEFNVEVRNSTGSTAYYGVWYQMIEPNELTNEIFIGKSANSNVSTTGSINNGATTTVSFSIENSSNSDVKINIGIGSSSKSTSDIEYLGGRKLITDEWAKAVSCVTGSTTTYYASLNEALNGASTTAATKCTLLHNLTEDVSTSRALYDTTIDFNGKVLNGTLVNSDASSNMTLMNGKITSIAERTIDNRGTITIKSGIYSNVGDYVVSNSGTVNITGGSFDLTTSTGGATLINSQSKNFNISNAIVSTNSYGVANFGGEVLIVDSDITGGDYAAVINLESGSTRIYNSKVSGAIALQNEAGSLLAFDDTITGYVSGQVPHFFHRSSVLIGVDLYNIAADRCATWTLDGGQDDLTWYNTASYTSSYQTYSYFNVDYSNHNSTTSAYATHCYNGNTFAYGLNWDWNFTH